ncbi:Folylpolyglutamate synthase [Ophiocordyceps camponoti-floridani]|uniref:Folylpolyglutamate synthase n=1 Tax=Ophiocordyceps camponoti-floridani TaxID=2030778 RepID=A0A8H4QA88_9HYPO|nr:Folylpolyglutamate synthase [Ophiocordyceps camponoti-floridani]
MIRVRSFGLGRGPVHHQFRRAMASSVRSYYDALDALNSLQTPFAVIKARRKAGKRPKQASLEEMRCYLRRLGYEPSHLAALNAIHVAGTKGKGSTCAYVDSILGRHRRAYGVPRSVGLFTSPHLVAVRERIRIDSKPISEEMFAKYFFQVYDCLGASTDDSCVPPGSRPIYSRFLTLMSWHVFLSERVDVAVYETGIGGAFDATNVIESPVAAGISTIGFDHTFVLGDTLKQIAWHKAGIIKTNRPAFTISQAPDAAGVIRQRAAEKGAVLKELDIDARLLDGVRIRPDADFQRKNATLAIALAEQALDKLGMALKTGAALTPEFIDGLEQMEIRGRCEIKAEDGLTWYIDGAHTPDSLEVSSKWFADETADCSGPRIFIFNQQSRSEAVDFLNAIHAAASRHRAGKPCFDHVVFCTNFTHASSSRRDFVNRQVDPDSIDKLTVQRRFAERWAELDPAAQVVVLPSVAEAIGHARQVAAEGETALAYVTGSLHLVGGVLSILEEADAL